MPSHGIPRTRPWSVVQRMQVPRLTLSKKLALLSIPYSALIDTKYDSPVQTLESSVCSPDLPDVDGEASLARALLGIMPHWSQARYARHKRLHEAYAP